MGNRRFSQVSTSDDDDDDAGETAGAGDNDNGDVPRRRRKRQQQNSPSSSEKKNHKKQSSDDKSKRTKKLREEDDEDYEEQEEEEDEEEEEEEEEEEVEEEEEEASEEEEEKSKRIRKRTKRKDEEEASRSDEDEEDEEEVEEEDPVDARPVGEPIKVSGKGRTRKTHYESFEYDGNQYDLEDPVLITPESPSFKIQKPYVAIIKDITQDKDGNVMMTGQWFYRPEEAEKKGGGNWQSNDTRELFYSFHRDDVPAESVMHRCVVHFVPIHKQLPNRKQYPGFIVRKVYDTVEKKLWKLTDKDYEDKKQHEIDLLVQKTMKRLVDLPDIEPEENIVDQEDHFRSKRSFRKKNITPLDVTRDEEATRPDQTPKVETPGSCLSIASEYYVILVNSNALTGETHRDKWLERLLQAVQYVCTTADGTNKDNNVNADANGGNHESETKALESSRSSPDKTPKDGQDFIWPDAAVQAVTALEKVSYDSDLKFNPKLYNQKLRQLCYNLKNTPLLARRFLKGELEPSKLLNMSPSELKEGLTAEETEKKEPDESEKMQMTDARCKRCLEFKVGIRDIIQAGHGERYQLQCIPCGHSWYASRDDVATLTIDAPSSSKAVGTAPLATEKFETVEKKLVSPRETDKASNVPKKTSEAVVETQKSFSKHKKEETPEAPKDATAKPE